MHVRLPLALLVLISLASTAGCAVGRDANRWEKRDAAAPVAGTTVQRPVVFAPVDVAPVAAFYPEAALDYAYAMRLDIDVRVREVKAWVGEGLPPSASEVWATGAQPTAAGAYLVVTTRVIDLHDVSTGLESKSGIAHLESTAEMRGYQADGKLVFLKKASGGFSGQTSPKLQTSDADPRSKAAWDAIRNCLATLRAYLERQQDLPDAIPGAVPAAGTVATAAPADVVGVPPAVLVQIDSEPSGADVLIDGNLMGTTPAQLHLPPKALTLRLERQGFQPWERQFTPTGELKLKPVLTASAGK
ncbi:MAG: PEGA domain-containing protein [Planctomycetes bacterium]|nr:PEGA domain-containing protein [Planctomycetota bacterium]